MEIKAVIVDEMPESCGRCQFLDMVYDNECPVIHREIDNINIRPSWCPLMVVDWQDADIDHKQNPDYQMQEGEE